MEKSEQIGVVNESRNVLGVARVRVRDSFRCGAILGPKLGLWAYGFGAYKGL